MRTKGLYEADKMLEIHTAQENPYLTECYRETIGAPMSDKAHHLLHTEYRSRRRISGADLDLNTVADGPRVTVSVCVGTSCYIRGSQDILSALMRHVEERGFDRLVDIRATFCYEKCDRGPSVMVGDTLLERCTFETVVAELNRQLADTPAA